jgi:hypothetical protein
MNKIKVVLNHGVFFMNFPAVLAGPIIRRVEPSKVYLWLATSKAYTINAELFNINAGQRLKTMESVCDTNSIQIGKKLYIHLLKIRPAQGHFPTNQLIGYNLSFKTKANSFDLEDLGLLSELSYKGLKYPTFFIHESAQQGRIIYGSCRKPHGIGEDSLSMADNELNKNAANINSRPHSLFFMGDQIYADSVADPLIRVIQKVGRNLIGQREKLTKIDKRLKHERFTTSIDQVNGRQFIIEYFCNFTTSHGDNHLIELGEFAAMYLFTWSPVLWEVSQKYNLFESFEDVLANDDIHFHFPDEKHYQKERRLEIEQLKTRYNDHQELLTTFQHSLYRVRRLLANIPTYMIFDDHDITDDWNISSAWKKNVKESPLGRHVVANGLSAYWAFQGWGNDPEAFDRRFIQTVSQYCDSLIKGKTSPFYESWTELLWNYNKWYFIAPTNPTAIFLDTRTQRQYETRPKPIKVVRKIEEANHPPQLVNDNQWQSIEKDLFDTGWQRKSPLIVVSASPLYGIGLIESFLHDHIYPFKALGLKVQTTFDYEGWKFNGKGFTTFLQNVARWNPNRCIILSGDVHYATAVRADVVFQNNKKLKIDQFTSSPMKNMSFSSIWGFMLKMVIRANSSRRRKKVINRYCDHKYHIEEINKGTLLTKPLKGPLN